LAIVIMFFEVVFTDCSMKFSETVLSKRNGIRMKGKFILKSYIEIGTFKYVSVEFLAGMTRI
jgi:hypothetical protein